MLGVMLCSLILPTAATAQDRVEPSAAAVLMVSDSARDGAEVTERMGVALYGRFLEEGPYAEVRILSGEQANLAETLRSLAERHSVIDCFLSTHTTVREPDSWARSLAGVGSKLRLVYSTACFGNEKEREAWERVGARTVVTHTGLNNPIVALPYFLSQWLSGEAVGPTVAEGFRETGAVVRYALSLPGLSAGIAASADAFGVGGDLVAGSQPVVSGDAGLRITDGFEHHTPSLPHGLRYRRESGGPLGLILRALAGRLEVNDADVHRLLARIKIAQLTPELASQLAKLESISVQWSRSRRMRFGKRPRLTTRTRRQAQIVLRFRRGIRIDLPNGLKLTTGRQVTLRPGAFDPHERVLAIHARGIWIGTRGVRAHLTHLRVQPARSVGYELKASVGLWGVLPFWKTLPIGGGTPEPDPGVGPILLNTEGGIDARSRAQ
jgi:hypothetical protein